MGFKKEKRPIDARTGSALGDHKFGEVRQTVIATTAGSTDFGPRGVFSLTSTSTGAVGFTYDINTAYKAGDRLSLMVSSIPGTTTPHKFRFGTATVAATSATAVHLSSNGAGISLIAVSTSRWLTDGNQGATFSTST